MKNKSIWLDNISREKYPKLDNDIECDILIIGGGITGICCGYFLKDYNKKVILVEGNKICTGTTAKSTGKLTYFTRDSINAKIAELGAKAASSVSKKTDYLITNEQSGSSKYKKAVELNIPIITEDEFLNMIGE